MTVAQVTNTRIKAGVWEGVLTGPSDMPHLQVTHLEVPVDGLRVTAVPNTVGQWALQLPIPVQMLHDGVQTFVIRDMSTAATLAHFTLIAGVTLDDDIRAELDLLRAELDLLKRAFRRHCVETAG